MEFFKRYLRQRRKILVACFTFCAVFSVSFALYHLPLAAVLYPFGLCALAAIGYAVFDYFKTRALHAELVRLRSLPAELIEELPPAVSVEAADYQAILQSLCEEQKRIVARNRAQQSRLIDYYTLWGHQIKTPIAAMRLHLQNEDSALSRTLSLELMRVEQYVEMLLAYLRLDSDSTDYVFREHSLDAVTRQAVRRFSGEFIARRLKLEYKAPQLHVVTDEKWLLFVLEQLLSNALKYTREGVISIYPGSGATLCIQDTGVGIAPEDLPRIFENGYTGVNGRLEQTASGLGLYLCKRILTNLGHDISIESTPGIGTVVCIDFSQQKIQAE